MALIGNRSVLHKSPMRMLGGDANAGDRSNFNKHGMVRSSRLTYGKLAALPNGYGGTGWMMPVTAGAISSTNAAVLSIAPSASGALGLPTSGTADFSISTNTPAGQLIAFGIGSASLLISTNNLLLTASLNAIGSASFVLTTGTPLLGATASGTGNASALFSASATILPANDASPLRTAAANFAITGSLTPYAIGSMSGSTVDTGLLTTAAILAAMNASPPAVNIKKVNDVDVTGTGAPGSEWGP